MGRPEATAIILKDERYGECDWCKQQSKLHAVALCNDCNSSHLFCKPCFKGLTKGNGIYYPDAKKYS